MAAAHFAWVPARPCGQLFGGFLWPRCSGRDPDRPSGDRPVDRARPRDGKGARSSRRRSAATVPFARTPDVAVHDGFVVGGARRPRARAKPARSRTEFLLGADGVAWGGVADFDDPTQSVPDERLARSPGEPAVEVAPVGAAGCRMSGDWRRRRSWSRPSPRRPACWSVGDRIPTYVWEITVRPSSRSGGRAGHR